MTTYLLSEWNDGLASTNYLESNGTDNTTLTVDWANSFCTQVLGPRFDTVAEQIVFDADELKPETTSKKTTSSSGSTTDDEVGDDAEEEELDAAA